MDIFLLYMKKLSVLTWPQCSDVVHCLLLEHLQLFLPCTGILFKKKYCIRVEGSVFTSKVHLVQQHR